MRYLGTAISFQCYRTSVGKHGERESGSRMNLVVKEKSQVAVYPFLVQVNFTVKMASNSVNAVFTKR